MRSGHIKKKKKVVQTSLSNRKNSTNKFVKFGIQGCNSEHLSLCHGLVVDATIYAFEKVLDLLKGKQNLKIFSF